MTIQLIEGQFKAGEALEIIAQMIQVKVKYHESKIQDNSNEEDIKNREAKIKFLQKELFEVRKSLSAKKGNLSIDAAININ